MSSFVHPLEEDYNSSSRSSDPWANQLADEVILGSKEIPPGIPGLYMLALQGRWQEIATRASQQPTLSSSNNTLELTTFHVMALMKLKVWQEAFLQLEKTKTIQPDESSWPFALRWLHAELPAALGHPQDAFNRFYSLLESCSNTNQSLSKQQSGQEKEEEKEELIWASRTRRCSLTLIALHTKRKQYKPALALINQLLIQDPHDLEAWSQAARVQLIMGDYPAAKRTIEQGKAAAAAAEIEALSSLDSFGNNKNRIESVKVFSMDEAMLFLLTGKPSEASELYQQASRRSKETATTTTAGKSEPCAVSMVNGAVCQAYAKDLVTARRELESIFLERPLDVLTESVVANIATLYGVVAPISSGGGSGGGGVAEDSRRKMGAWVATAAPDDFDLSCCKSGGPSTV